MDEKPVIKFKWPYVICLYADAPWVWQMNSLIASLTFSALQVGMISSPVSTVLVGKSEGVFNMKPNTDYTSRKI